jgi:hypothetical protein
VAEELDVVLVLRGGAHDTLQPSARANASTVASVVKP